MRDGLPLDAQRVLDAVPSRVPHDVDRIASVAGLDVPTVRRALGVLAGENLVCHGLSGWQLVRGAKTRLAAPRADFVARSEGQS